MSNIIEYLRKQNTSRLLIYVLGVFMLLLLALGLRNCKPGAITTKQVITDSVRYEVRDSIVILYDTQVYEITKPVPYFSSPVPPINTMLADSLQNDGGGSKNNCSCLYNLYRGRIPLQNGYVNYDISTFGEITNMKFEPNITLQNRFKSKKFSRITTDTQVIDNTPKLWLSAGAEVNPQALLNTGLWADLHLKKWVFGYRYEFNTLAPHNARVGIKIFSL